MINVTNTIYLQHLTLILCIIDVSDVNNTQYINASDVNINNTLCY